MVANSGYHSIDEIHLDGQAMSQLFFDILDEKRRAILPSFRFLQGNFYLAGGTALALQLGHRDSIDFDFFSPNSFSTGELFQELEKNFEVSKLKKIQEEEGTLTVTVDGVKVSFFHFPYPLVRATVKSEFFDLASIEDIGAMKLSAITSRSLTKDYVDLYFILHQVELSALLDVARHKFPTLETNLLLKSLVYFDDIIEEPIIFKHNRQVDLSAVSNFLRDLMKKYLSKR